LTNRKGKLSGSTKALRAALSAARGVAGSKGYECSIGQGGEHAYVEVRKGSEVYRVPVSKGGKADPTQWRKLVEKKVRKLGLR